MSLLLRRIQNNTELAGESTQLDAQPGAQPGAQTPDSLVRLKERVRTATIEVLKNEVDANGERVRTTIDDVLGKEGADISRVERSRIACEIYDDIMGCGPLEALLADPDITEIMVNGCHNVFVERGGRISQADVTFRDQEHLLTIIDRIVSTVGRHIDEASPMVDARLKDGSRVNVIIPPLSLVGPVVTIRKFSKKPYGMQDLVNFGSLSPKMASFLEACVRGRLNIVVSGGTGSGKTTLLNVLSACIPADERIITIEDAAEIQLNQSHVITLESRPANMEGRGQITIRDLVRNALRMRPDRIIVGEVRSAEALDMLQAMNTGHDGSLTTLHANTPRDALARLETMVLMAGMDLPLQAIRSQAASAVDIIIQQSRFRDGTRRITNVTEVIGMEGDVISMQDIFEYDVHGQAAGGSQARGRFRSTGVTPHCLEKIRYQGVAVHEDWFV